MVKTGAHGVGLSLDSGPTMFDSRFIDETEIAISAGDCDLGREISRRLHASVQEAKNVGS